jgi:YesN/AraC family two-component response regulator
LAKNLCESKPNLKVVVMSGYAEFSAGSGEFEKYLSLAKPFSMVSLVEKMNEVLHGTVAQEKTSED